MVAQTSTLANVLLNKDKSQDVVLTTGSLGLDGSNTTYSSIIPLFDDPACTKPVTGAFICFFTRLLTLNNQVTTIFEEGIIHLDNNKIAIKYEHVAFGQGIYFLPSNTYTFATKLYGNDNKAGNQLKISVDATGNLRTITFPRSSDINGVSTKRSYYYSKETFNKYPDYMITNKV